MIYTSSILPSSIISASNAVLLYVVMWMLASDVMYLMTLMRDKNNRFADIYYKSKAAVAHGLLMLGLVLKLTPTLVIRYAEIHHIELPSWSIWPSNLLIVGTVMAAVAGMCWTRVVTPNRWPQWVWFALTLSALAVGGVVLF